MPAVFAPRHTAAINSGFTNLIGGYTSIPNTDLKPETSHNVEAGARSSFGRLSIGVTGFSNHFDNFIDQVARGVNPATGLLEYQHQNVSQVDIHGIELQGEAQLTRSVRLRGSYAAIRGNDVSGPSDVPLGSIPPDQGVLALSYAAPTNRWGSDVSLRAARGQSSGDRRHGLLRTRGV